MFAPSNVTRQLHFAYHMLGSHIYMASLRLEFWSGSGWTPLWQNAGKEIHQWSMAVVTVPEDAEVLRFAGRTPDNGWRGDMALDAIVVGVPAIDFEDLACNFIVDMCFWLNAGNASWVRTSDSSDNWWLLSAGSESEVQSFILESLEFNPTTATKALFFWYSLTGSSSVSLQVEHKTEAGWLPLFSQTGDTGTAWKGAPIRVPEGTLSLRLLAEADAASTVQIDDIVLLAAGDWASLSCSFETDYCAWSSSLGEQPWFRNSGQTPSSDDSGPLVGAFAGNWYIYTDFEALEDLKL